MGLISLIYSANENNKIISSTNISATTVYIYVKHKEKPLNLTEHWLLVHKAFWKNKTVLRSNHQLILLFKFQSQNCQKVKTSKQFLRFTSHSPDHYLYLKII